MIAIDDKLISDELFEKKFVCDLSACKGACCVEGESGAPVADDEREKLREVWPIVKEYITAKGVAAIEEQGHFIVDEDGEYVTPLIDGKECAYTIFEADGMAKCGIEKAAREGKIDWLKPVSCHLYPVRITKLKDFDAINFHTWEVCEPACDCGSKLDVHVYKFLKDAFIRKYGQEFFEKMEAASELYQAQLAKGDKAAK